MIGPVTGVLVGSTILFVWVSMPEFDTPDVGLPSLPDFDDIENPTEEVRDAIQDVVQDLQEFVMASIIEAFLVIFGFFIGFINAIFQVIVEILEGLGSTLVSVGEILADVPYFIIDPVEELLISIAGTSGPVSPMVVTLFWAAALTVVLLLVKFAIGLIRRLFRRVIV